MKQQRCLTALSAEMDRGCDMHGQIEKKSR